MLDKENDTLIINSKLLFTYKNKLIISDIEFDKDLKKSPINKNNNISTLQFPDDILSIHHLSSLNKILVSCISNKTLYLLDEKIIYNDQKTLSEFNLEKDALIFKSNKKMTSIISYHETKEKYFLLISDKFGEISMKPITKKENEESFSKEIKILTGHCDTINFLKLSLDNKLLLSSDNFGKIKIYNFPNIFNVLSVILYHEDEIIYTNFAGEKDKCFFVINKSGNIDLWSIYDFIKKKEINLTFLNGEKIIEVKTLNKNEYILLKTNKKYFLIKIDDTKFNIEKIKEMDIISENNNNKEKLESKFFENNCKIYQVLFDLDNNKIKEINDII
jgi:hypothetical protein